jgi:anti-anti-sigma regulatory factor
MVSTRSHRRAVFHLATVNQKQCLDLVEVEGDLETPAARRWTGLLQGAVNNGTTGIAVDLRACRAVDSLCLSALVATSAILKARGGGGVKLVTIPQSPLGRRLRTAGKLPSYDSAVGALMSLDDAG